MKNMGRFGVDFADLEKGRFKFLDFATTKEPGMSSTLNELLNETFSIKARRLVVDSFSAMAHACMKEVLIPVSDLSVLLDAFAKIPRERTRKPRTILFDNLSDTILMCGFDKTYRFLRFLLEAISSPKITALFIFNPSAHNPAISSSIRGLFQFRLTDLKLKIVESIRRD